MRYRRRYITITEYEIHVKTYADSNGHAYSLRSYIATDKRKERVMAIARAHDWGMIRYMEGVNNPGFLAILETEEIS